VSVTVGSHADPAKVTPADGNTLDCSFFLENLFGFLLDLPLSYKNLSE
jgi:hypothetical protein